jgi:hypothetical protein
MASSLRSKSSPVTVHGIAEWAFVREVRDIYGTWDCPSLVCFPAAYKRFNRQPLISHCREHTTCPLN